MKLISIIGAILVSLGMVWLPLLGLGLFVAGHPVLWTLAAISITCLTAGIYLLISNGPDPEEIEKANAEEAEAMYNGRMEEDKDNK